jgi:hypothetical protein
VTTMMRWYQPAQWQLWCADINLYSDNYDALISTCNLHSNKYYGLILNCTVTTMMRWYQPAQWQLWCADINLQWQLWCADINLHSDNCDALISTCTVTTMMRWYQPVQWQLWCADINLPSDKYVALISTCTLTTCHLRQVLHDLTLTFVNASAKLFAESSVFKSTSTVFRQDTPTTLFEHLTSHGDWRMASRRQRIYIPLNSPFRDTVYLLTLPFVSLRCPERSFQCVYLSAVCSGALSIS